MAKERDLIRNETIRLVTEVMEVLQQTKGPNREQEIIGILESAAKLSIPWAHVRLDVETF